MPRPTDALGLLGGSRSSYGDGYSRFSADVLPFNVKDYGAKGNNVADDTRAIQEAIQEAEVTIALFGGLVAASVYVPSGRYLVTASLLWRSHYVRMFGAGGIAPQGQGFGASIIRATGAGPVFRNAVAASTNLVGLHLENLAIDARGLNAGGVGIELDNVSRSTFRQVFVNLNGVGGLPVGIDLIGNNAGKQSVYNVFDNIELQVGAGAGSGVHVRMTDVCNANRFLYGVIQGGAGIGLVVACTNLNCDTNLFYGCGFQGSHATCIDLSSGGGSPRASEFVFDACRFEPTAPTSIVMNGYRCVFRACSYTTNVTWTGGAGFGNVVTGKPGLYNRGTLGASQNDYNPDGDAALGMEYQRLSSSAAINITGLSRGWESRRIVFINTNAANIITFTHQDAASAAANRFLMAGGANVAVGPDDSIEFIYDATTQRWRHINTQA